MNKKILLSSVLALTISLAPISSAKAMDFQIGPPGPRDENGNVTRPSLPQRIQISINSKDSVKAGEPIKFETDAISKLRGGDHIVSYSWDFGDGNASSDSAPSHVFTEPGVYTVKLRFDATARPGYQQKELKKYLGETTKTIIVE
jgi:hypothetical protein